MRFFSTSTIMSKKSLVVRKVAKGKPKVPNSKLVFGHSFTDHMLTIEWTKGDGWETPIIRPYENLSLPPSATVFHYGVECFEGMKAYKDSAGHIRLFRPMMNMERLAKSATRLALPAFDKGGLLECVEELVKLDHSWIPQEKGYSLYIRPTMIATQETLGVAASDKACLFVILSPVGPYYKTGFAAVSLLANEKHVRAWPGGTGSHKVGGNYAPCILPQREASERGYQQNLWLFGPDHEITEVGTMNCFILWENENHEKELITPALDGTILPGVTRDSILTLCKDWGEFKVNGDGRITMPQLTRALKEGRVFEMFGAGTAAIVSPIKRINYLGQDWEIPIDAKLQAGPLTKRLMDEILLIQYGQKEYRGWSHLIQ